MIKGSYSVPSVFRVGGPDLDVGLGLGAPLGVSAGEAKPA